MRADAMQRRQNIIRTASRVMAEHGGDVALETIASASGVGIATLYRNFRSREELIDAIVDDTIGRVLEAIAEAQDTLLVDPSLAWRGLLTALAELNLGTLTDAVSSRISTDPSDEHSLEQRQRPALDALDALLEVLNSRAVVRSDLTSLEVIIAIATITRPHVAGIQRVASHVSDHLLEAYLAWTAGARV